MEFDVNKINKTDISPNGEYIGLGKKNNTNIMDCVDCDNCEQHGKWVPSSGISNDCNCDCRHSYDCSNDCASNYNGGYDVDYNCYVDDDNWYPGGAEALFGPSDCDCNCVCHCDCEEGNCDMGDGFCNLSNCHCDCECSDCDCYRD